MLLFADVAEELRLPTASGHPNVRPATGEGHAVGRRRHAALLRDSRDGDPGREDDRVSHRLFLILKTINKNDLGPDGEGDGPTDWGFICSNKGIAPVCCGEGHRVPYDPSIFSNFKPDWLTTEFYQK